MSDRDLMQQALKALETNQPVNYCMNNNGEKFPMMQEDPFRFDRNTKAIAALRERLAQPEQTVSMTEYKRLQDLVTSQGIRLMEYESEHEPEPVAWIRKNGFRFNENLEPKDDSEIPLYTAPPQPKTEQKPVATVVGRQYEDGTYAGNALDWAGRNCEDDFPVGTKLYTSPQPEQEPFCYHDGRNIVGKEYADHSDVFPLYTAPPKREWVGLTDEEFLDLSYLSQKIDVSNSLWFDRWGFARAMEAKLKEKNT